MLQGKAQVGKDVSRLRSMVCVTLTHVRATMVCVTLTHVRATMVCVTGVTQPLTTMLEPVCVRVGSHGTVSRLRSSIPTAAELTAAVGTARRVHEDARGRGVACRRRGVERRT